MVRTLTPPLTLTSPFVTFHVIWVVWNVKNAAYIIAVASRSKQMSAVSLKRSRTICWEKEAALQKSCIGFQIVSQNLTTRDNNNNKIRNLLVTQVRKLSSPSSRPETSSHRGRSRRRQYIKHHFTTLEYPTVVFTLVESTQTDKLVWSITLTYTSLFWKSKVRLHPIAEPRGFFL